MKNMPVSNVRSFTLLGHRGSGKTSLSEAIAFKLGLNDRLGSPDNGTSISDFTEQEKERKISIFASPFMGTYKDFSLTWIDSPGYLDFFGQSLCAASASDAAIFTVDAVSGVQVGTNKAWHGCDKVGVNARAFAVTGLDKENASFEKALESIRTTFGNSCIPLCLPAEYAAAAEPFKAELAEIAAETDDALLEKFLEGEELTEEELAGGLVKAVAKGTLRPVFITLALKDTGVTELLDAICKLFPAPGVSRNFVDTDGNVVPPDPEAPFVGYVWRTTIDAFVGQLDYVRVVSGTLKPQMQLLNTTNNGQEIASNLILTLGKKQTPVDSATPGDIVAIPKLKDTHYGHTLAAPTVSNTIVPLSLPPPVHYVAVEAETQGDEDKLGKALARLPEQFPTVEVEMDRETKQTLIKALGDVQIDVIVSLMKTLSNANVKISTPKVAYRETITGKGEGHYRHKKQSGGRGQFGEVYLRVMPLPEGSEEWFQNHIVGGAIPGNFIPAVQKGVSEAFKAGAVAGYPVQNVCVELYDGSYHDVDSSEVAFKIAGSRAFREAMSNAKPVILEPIMTLKITIPDADMGTVTGDLNHRRGRILGMEMIEGLQVITAEVPMSEIFQYSAQLRSMTGGRGSFEIAPSRYEIVPSNIAKKIADAADKSYLEDDDE